MTNKLFSPKQYAVRQPTDNAKRNGKILNPPRLPELGGMTKGNAAKADASLRIRKPGGTA